MLNGPARGASSPMGDCIADHTISGSLSRPGPVHGTIDAGTEHPILRSNVGQRDLEGGFRVCGCSGRAASKKSGIRSFDYGPAELAIPARIETED